MHFILADFSGFITRLGNVFSTKFRFHICDLRGNFGREKRLQKRISCHLSWHTSPFVDNDSAQETLPPVARVRVSEQVEKRGRKRGTICAFRSHSVELIDFSCSQKEFKCSKTLLLQCCCHEIIKICGRRFGFFPTAVKWKSDPMENVCNSD